MNLIEFFNQCLGIIRERIKIKCHTTGKGFDILFPNGTLTVQDQPGGYVIASGCGSGKTESIKSLIRQKWDKGILYCVDTIAECNKMYDWLNKNLIGKKLNRQKLEKDDILMLHSGCDFSDKDRYRNNPELIVKCRILIITHVRFLTDLIHLFVTYEPNNPNPHIPPFDGNFQNLMTQKNLREYLIFDETPLFLKPFISIPREIVGIFSNEINGKYQCKSIDEIKRYYDKFIKGGVLGFCDGDSKADRMKRETVFNLIPVHYPEWIPKKDKKFDIQFYPSHLIVSNMTTHVLIYEGVGDVLLGSSPKFKLLDIPRKYKDTVLFRGFDFKLSRKNTPSDKEYNDFVFKVKSLCTSLSGKTLIVIWKDFKDDDLNDTTNKSEWVNRLEEKLKKGGLRGDSFSVTYYGAADTKSTNQYRDYENIILCGNWDLPPSVSAKFRKAYNSLTTQDEYKFWYMVQLILRIGIRNHKGKTYTVYYSSDFQADFITALKDYLNQNKLNIPSRKQSVPVWQSEVEKYSKMYVSPIEKLITYNPDLEKAIVSHSKFTLDITLDEIYRRLGKTNQKKETKTFKPLIRFLDRHFGIILNIQVNRKGKKKP